MFCALSVVPPTNPRELPDLARLTPFAWAGSAHFVRERHAGAPDGSLRFGPADGGALSDPGPVAACIFRSPWVRLG